MVVRRRRSTTVGTFFDFLIIASTAHIQVATEEVKNKNLRKRRVAKNKEKEHEDGVQRLLEYAEGEDEDEPVSPSKKDTTVDTAEESGPSPMKKKDRMKAYKDGEIPAQHHGTNGAEKAGDGGLHLSKEDEEKKKRGENTSPFPGSDNPGEVPKLGPGKGTNHHSSAAGARMIIGSFFRS